MKQIFISECICLSLQRFEQFCLLEDNGLWTSQKISICKSHSWPTSITLWLSHLQAILFCVFFITSSVHRRWQRCLQPEATVEQQEEQPVWKRRKVRKCFIIFLGNSTFLWLGFVVLVTWKKWPSRARIKAMVGWGKNRRRRARFTLKYISALFSAKQNLDLRGKSNHGNDLEEGGDEEEVGEEQGEQQGGGSPTLLPLAEGDLRYNC